MSHAITKEKKNIVADPVFEAVKGKRVSLSTVKGDYDNVLVIHFDQFTLIVEIEGKHLLIGKASIVDMTIPDEVVDTVLSNIDEAFKVIEIKQENAKERKFLKRERQPVTQTNQPQVHFKKKRTY